LDQKEYIINSLASEHDPILSWLYGRIEGRCGAFFFNHLDLMDSNGGQRFVTFQKGFSTFLGGVHFQRVRLLRVGYSGYWAFVMKHSHPDSI